MVQKLDEVHKDFLEEMASIGAGNASTLLSNQTNREVNVTVSTFDMMTSREISKTVNVSTKLVVVQYASLGGELGGSVLLIFPRESALSLVDLVQKRKLGTTEWLSEDKQEILKQVSESLVMCYIDAIKNFLKVRLQPGDLRVFSTYGETIADLVDLTLRKKSKQLFYLNTRLSIKPNIEGEFVFLFDEKLSTFLLKKSAEMLAK